MKVVIHKDWGLYWVPDEVAEKIGATIYDDSPEVRTNPEFIKYADKSCGEYAVVDLPEEISDWYVDDYDGRESVIYVLDGKLYRSDWDAKDKKIGLF